MPLPDELLYNHQAGPKPIHSLRCMKCYFEHAGLTGLAYAVDITLVPLDAAKHVEDSFREEVEKYLKVHGHDVVWVPSGAGLTVLLHQPEQRVNPQAVLEAIKSYRRRGMLLIAHVACKQSASRSCFHIANL